MTDQQAIGKQAHQASTTSRAWQRRWSLLILALSILACAGGRSFAAVQTFYSFSLVRPGGTVVPLAQYKGKVVVIVNLASKSSFADQLGGLEKLSEQYKEQGLVVLGVPSNDFGAEEPDDDATIQKYYAEQHISFPVMAKSAVSGKDALPVYGFLTAAPAATKDKDKSKDKEPAANRDVHWSFTKFIVTRDGLVGARFEPDMAPDSPDFQIAVEKALAGKLKPGGATPGAGSGGASGGDDDDDAGE